VKSSATRWIIKANPAAWKSSRGPKNSCTDRRMQPVRATNIAEQSDKSNWRRDIKAPLTACWIVKASHAILQCMQCILKRIALTACRTKFCRKPDIAGHTAGSRHLFVAQLQLTSTIHHAQVSDYSWKTLAQTEVVYIINKNIDLGLKIKNKHL